MRIGIATDHGGYGLKQELVVQLRTAGHEVIDFGAQSLGLDDDYPDYVTPLARAVAAGQVERGVAICGSGVGASVCANKIPGVRAALIHDHFSARQGVEDDHMNIIRMGGRTVGPAVAGPSADLLGGKVQPGRTTSAPLGQASVAGRSTRCARTGQFRGPLRWGKGSTILSRTRAFLICINAKPLGMCFLRPRARTL